MSQMHSQQTIDRLRRLCEIHPVCVAAEIVGISRGTAFRIKRRGWRQAELPTRARPTDFAIQCHDMTIEDLARHYGASDHTVRRWAKEVGRVRRGGRRSGRPIPGDLASVVDQLGPYGAADHYGVSYGTVKRWRKILGLPMSWSRQPARRRLAVPATKSAGWADRYIEENNHVGR